MSAARWRSGVKRIAMHRWWQPAVHFFLLAACVFAVVSCATDSTAGGDPPPPSAPPPPTTLPPPPAQTDAELDVQLSAELARIEQRATASQATHDSLRSVWAEVLDGDLVLPLTELLRCEPVPYEGDAKILGPDGGTIHFGKHKLHVPAGALAAKAVISAEAPPGLDVAVEFSPSGVGFQVPLELDLSYEHCAVSALLSPLRGAWVSDSGVIIEFPSARDDRRNDKVEVWLDHFSKYAVAY